MSLKTKEVVSLMRDRYWNLMVDARVLSAYGRYYFEIVEKYDIGIAIVSGLLSSYGIISVLSGSLSAVIFSVILATAQVIAIIRPYLPFSKQMTSCNFLEFECQDLFRDMENGWHRMLEFECDFPESDEIVRSFQERFDRIEERAKSHVSIPVNQKAYDKAVDEMNQYFSIYLPSDERTCVK